MIAFDPTLHEVRDAAQVIGLTAWAAREDCAGRLGAHLNAYRANIAREELARAEGWVVGVG